MSLSRDVALAQAATCYDRDISRQICRDIWYGKEIIWATTGKTHAPDKLEAIERLVGMGAFDEARAWIESGLEQCKQGLEMLRLNTVRDELFHKNKQTGDEFEDRIKATEGKLRSLLRSVIALGG